MRKDTELGKQGLPSNVKARESNASPSHGILWGPVKIGLQESKKSQSFKPKRNLDSSIARYPPSPMMSGDK